MWKYITEIRFSILDALLISILNDIIQKVFTWL